VPALLLRAQRSTVNGGDAPASVLPGLRVSARYGYYCSCWPPTPFSLRNLPTRRPSIPAKKRETERERERERRAGAANAAVQGRTEAAKGKREEGVAETGGPERGRILDLLDVKRASSASPSFPSLLRPGLLLFPFRQWSSRAELAAAHWWCPASGGRRKEPARPAFPYIRAPQKLARRRRRRRERRGRYRSAPRPDFRREVRRRPAPIPHDANQWFPSPPTVFLPRFPPFPFFIFERLPRQQLFAFAHKQLFPPTFFFSNPTRGNHGVGKLVGA
jgi:hypothetical protein